MAAAIASIHKAVEPVRAYAKQLSEIKGEPHSVITIPAGSAAHNMGYRFVSIPDAELPEYIAGGAMIA